MPQAWSCWLAANIGPCDQLDLGELCLYLRDETFLLQYSWHVAWGCNEIGEGTASVSEPSQQI